MTDQALTLGSHAGVREGARERQATRLETAFNIEVLSGLRLAMRTRGLALLAIGIWVAIQNWSNGAGVVLYFEALIAVFVLLGVAQYQVAKARRGDTRFQYLFTLADVCLLTFTLLMPNPFDTFELAIQMHLRWPTFLYFFIIGAGVLLNYSPKLMLWNGLATVLAWSAGVWSLASLPDSIVLGLVRPAETPIEEWIALYLNETSVDAVRWLQQIIIYLVFAGIMAAVVWRARRLVQNQTASERERANLSRYFSPNIVDDLAQSDQPLGDVRRQNVAVLFADIVGFTRLSEDKPPEEVIDLLRGFHGRMEQQVFAHGGTLDKYIGDGVMATFGTPSTGPEDACQALACARAMHESLADWNVERHRSGEAPIRVGIGAHYGPVVLGDTGGEHRLEFAVVGDTVNVASRLERLTRTLGAEIVLSGELAERARREKGRDADALLAGFTAQEAQDIRGRTGSVPIWTFGEGPKR